MEVREGVDLCHVAEALQGLQGISLRVWQLLLPLWVTAALLRWRWSPSRLLNWGRPSRVAAVTLGWRRISRRTLPRALVLLLCHLAKATQDVCSLDLLDWPAHGLTGLRHSWAGVCGRMLWQGGERALELCVHGIVGRRRLLVVQFEEISDGLVFILGELDNDLAQLSRRGDEGVYYDRAAAQISGVVQCGSEGVCKDRWGDAGGHDGWWCVQPVAFWDLVKRHQFKQLNKPTDDQVNHDILTKIIHLLHPNIQPYLLR